MARIPKGARLLLLEILKRGPLKATIETDALKELKRRGLVTCTSRVVTITATSAREIETYTLTKRGMWVAERLAAPQTP